MRATSLARLRASIRGELLLPPDEAFVVRCSGVADVVRAIELACDEGLPVAVGRSARAGFVVVDLSRWRSIRLDLVRRRATVDPGVTWAELDHETQAYGLATAGDMVSTAGVVEAALRRSVGWLTRKHGLTGDNVLAADVVTSGGRFLRVNGDELVELGARCVVTTLELQLHPVGPEVTAGAVAFDDDETDDVVRRYRAWADDAPQELTTLLAVSGTVAVVAGCFAGERAAAARAFRSLTELGTPLAEQVRVRRYTDVQATLLEELSLPR